MNKNVKIKYKNSGRLAMTRNKSFLKEIDHSKDDLLELIEQALWFKKLKKKEPNITI